MAKHKNQLAISLEKFFGTERILEVNDSVGQISMDVSAEHWQDVARDLRDEASFGFEQLIDLCGMDYLTWGEAEWDTTTASHTGFSRGVEGQGAGRFDWSHRPQEVFERKTHPGRFAVVVQLLSVRHNQRLRIRCFAEDDQLPILSSLVEIWSSANWYEREAFDLFGIAFEGHPDLRRLLTDYGFVGHPFRKDFPLIGNVALSYDEELKRVVYRPVEIEPRVLVPRVIRDDSRAHAESGSGNGEGKK